MTEEELKKVEFKFVSSMSGSVEHTITYSSKDGSLGFCDHTKVKKNGGFGRSYRHWRIKNKVYDKWEDFIEALKDFQMPFQVIKNE